MSFRSKASRAIWHTRQMKKEACATVSPNAPITSTPGKGGHKKKTVACVSLRDQWVSLPLHSASRAPAAGSYLTHPTSSPEQSSKPGAFSIRSPFLKLLVPVFQQAGDRPVLSTISISSVPRELELMRGAEISGVSETMGCRNPGDQ